MATGSIAAADAAGRQLGGVRGAELVSAAHSAFVDSMAAGMRVAAAVALVAAIGAIFFLPRPSTAAPAAADPAAREALVLADSTAQ